jgi:pullulanase/glycogen debranching enzyme
MTDDDWANPDARAVAVALPNAMLLVNAWWESLTFRIPGDDAWSVELDTADGRRRGRAVTMDVDLAGRSLVLLRRTQCGAATQTA